MTDQLFSTLEAPVRLNDAAGVMLGKPFGRCLIPALSSAAQWRQPMYWYQFSARRNVRPWRWLGA